MNEIRERVARELFELSDYTWTAEGPMPSFDALGPYERERLFDKAGRVIRAMREPQLQ